MSNLLVVVSICLLKYIDEVATRHVNPLTCRVVRYIIDKVPTREARNYGAGIGVQDYEPFRVVGRNKQAMSSFVKRHGDIVFRLLPNRPSCGQRTLSPVNNTDCVLSRYIDEHPRP